MALVSAQEGRASDDGLTPPARWNLVFEGTLRGTEDSTEWLVHEDLFRLIISHPFVEDEVELARLLAIADEVSLDLTHAPEIGPTGFALIIETEHIGTLFDVLPETRNLLVGIRIEGLNEPCRLVHDGISSSVCG